mmetsp:Transcript_2643/g.3730  ORF Transcript_2643/g.3730 Transcript_2643/m.3730 type:complete len:362 (-) Transcript_2643:140-1225(-)
MTVSSPDPNSKSDPSVLENAKETIQTGGDALIVGGGAVLEAAKTVIEAPIKALKKLTIDQIFHTPFTGNQEEVCKRMVESLSEKEKETAARSSYKYFSCADMDDASKPSTEVRDKCAMAMARRHLVAEDEDEKSALKKMKATIAYRDEFNVDAIRRCFMVKDDPSVDDKTHEKLRELVVEQLKDKKYYIQGNDNESRSCYFIVGSVPAEYDHEWYLVGHIFNLERAIARTERLTNGKLEKVNVILDYDNYNRKLAPPMALVKQLISCLSNHYPERMERAIVLDAPLAFRALWTLVKPFLDPNTKKKVKFVSGKSQKREKLSEIYSLDQVQPFVIPEGKKTNDFDIQLYMSKYSFDHDVDNE